MKYILKSILLFSSLVAVVACSDLEEDLIGDITSPLTTEGVDNSGVIRGPATDFGATLSSYSRLRDGSAGHNGYWSIQSVSTDEMAVTQKGGDWYDGGIWIDMHRHTFSPAHGAIKAAWDSQYQSIAECNDALNATESLDPDQTAQVRVLRAFFHYRLLDLFGRIKVINDASVDPPQSSSAEAFDLIEGELLDVLGIAAVNPGMDLSGSDLSTDQDLYKVNQFAALGLLAKLYLNAVTYTGSQRYQEAATAADYIINNGGYMLAGDEYSVPNLGKRPTVDEDPEDLVGYAALFAPNNFDNSEMIWAIDFDEVSGGGMNFAHMTLHQPSQFTWNIESQPWNGYAALEEFYNSYDDTDARKTASFISGNQLDYSGSQLVDFAATDGEIALNYSPDINELEPNANRDGGVRLGKFSFKQFQRNEANNDYPIIRLGDMYLIRGEALARASGDWALAANDVNTIRARAGISPLGTTTEADVLAERGREMFMEVTRRQDLIRFGKFNDAWWEKNTSDAYRTVFPIPSEAISASSGSLTQNPGY